MIGLELAVEQGEPADPQPCHQPRQRDLRRVALPRHHAFAEKGAAEREAIEAADQPITIPAFDRMRITEPVERSEGGFDLPADPGFGAVGRPFGTEPNHGLKRGVGGDAEAIGGDRLFERARQMEAVERQDRAALGLDPVHAIGLAMIGHREHADGIGAEHHPGIEPRHASA